LTAAIQKSLTDIQKEGEMPTEIKNHVQHIKNNVENEITKKKEKMDGAMIKMEIQEILEKGIEIDYQD
jgi:L-lysine 2,3-aminomutase